MKSTKSFHSGRDWWRRLWQGLGRPWGRQRERRLRLCENLGLGERRFLSVVECGKQKFLVGGSAHSVAVLVELAGEEAAAPTNGHEDVPTYKFVSGQLTKDVG